MNTLTSLAGFMLPGLALWLPSGYSWGAVLLLLASLGSLHRWPMHRFDRETLWLAATIMAVGLLWLFQSDGQGGSGRWDRFSKYALAIPCLLYAVAYPPSVKALRLGGVVGGLGAGAIALWQVYGQGMVRAAGHTNAIQFGNLALMLAVLAALQLAVGWRALSLRWRIGSAAAVLLAMEASVLSLSRGGWLALIWLPVLCWPLLRQIQLQQKTIPLRWLLVVALLLTVPLLSNMHVIKERFDLMSTEVAAYQADGQAQSSVGHRLEHWRLAWHLGLEKPLLGWGDVGYKQEKNRLVELGLFDVSTTYFDHAHNEVLDMFAKRGGLGVVMLLVFYVVPLALFWPTASRMRGIAATSDGQNVAAVQAVLWLRLSASAIILMYIAFGWTQVFFAHNSGTMCYLFMLVFFWAALHGLECSLQKYGRRPLQST
ncbi:O-antigen ligase family protein [Lampropedia puyangensis]|uniref:O-antigen ligase family protein n=2 Tax=Lampropedia puyangensis TaxID=1330072 RepID=A0A4S8F2N3_9BURK|nr:O-antigen ligase family protein [Lampropedia puyangensis]